jgi:hypothetical protein
MRKHITLIGLLLFVLNCNAQRTVGLLTHEHSSEDGYVLFPPLYSKNTYLIDKCGKQIKNWNSNYNAGACAYLLENGKLLRAGSVANPTFNAGPTGGVIEMYDWNGTLNWSYNISDSTKCQHHDLAYLPNGHVLAIVWDYKSKAEAISKGRSASLVGNAVWSEKIVELEPVGKNSANIVWEWKVWDHLIQNTDPAKPGYDSIRNHPERININFTGSGAATTPDWIHMNGIAYNADLDQIVVSSYYWDEIWIIDHSTTTAEAAGRTGGLRGKGGDLLYRWGNPQSYKVGTVADQRLFGVHSPYWIERGRLDSGGIMFYNNGVNRPAGAFSTVEILIPPTDGMGGYQYTPKTIYLPTSAQMVYTAPTPTDFYSPNISNAQRLQNGNTLICEGAEGYLFEVDPAGQTVWSYKNPDAALIGPVAQGVVPPQNSVFKSIQYPADYPGFAGLTLTPGAPIEQNPGVYDCYFQPLPTAVVNATTEGDWTVVNPFNDRIQISSGKVSQKTELRLFNALGQVCENWTIQAGAQGQHTLNTGKALPSGVYLLEIADASGSRQVQRLSHL